MRGNIILLPILQKKKKKKKKKAKYCILHAIVGLNDRKLELHCLKKILEILQ